jgi:hypothetical protein
MAAASAFVDPVEQQCRPSGFCWGAGVFDPRTNCEQCCGYRYHIGVGGHVRLQATLQNCCRRTTF